jgi:hypothetical protein
LRLGALQNRGAILFLVLRKDDLVRKFKSEHSAPPKRAGSGIDGYTILLWSIATNDSQGLFDGRMVFDEG